MTLVNAAPSQTATVLNSSSAAPASVVYQVFTSNVIEPVVSSVTIALTSSSPYLDELKAEAFKRSVLAAQKATETASLPKTDVMSAIRYCESRNDYAAQNRYSSASGAYQFLDSTWAYFGGYQRAKDAPAQVQDQKAYQTMQLRGTAPWNASRSCWARYVG